MTVSPVGPIRELKLFVLDSRRGSRMWAIPRRTSIMVGAPTAGKVDLMVLGHLGCSDSSLTLSSQLLSYLYGSGLLLTQLPIVVIVLEQSFFGLCIRNALWL